MKRKFLSTVIATTIISASINPMIINAKANGTWIESNNNWWYSYADGSYAKSEYVDGYWLNSTGWYDSTWNGHWSSNSIGWWYESNNWYPTNQWLKIDGTWYYFKSSGYMACNEWIGNYYIQSDGTMARDMWIGDYYVGSDGAWVPNKQKTTNTKPVEQTTEKTTETTTEQKTTEQTTTEQNTAEPKKYTVGTLEYYQNKYPNGCVEYDNNYKWVFFVSGNSKMNPADEPTATLSDTETRKNYKIYYEDGTQGTQIKICPYITNFSRIDRINRIVYYTDANDKEYSHTYTTMSLTGHGYSYLNGFAYCYPNYETVNTWIVPIENINDLNKVKAICPDYFGWADGPNDQ